MSVTHWIVWEGSDPEMVSLECVCGRRFVGRLATKDLAAHLASKNVTEANAPTS